MFASGTAQAINVLLGNDDGWAEANLRQLYADVKTAGHNALLSAPAWDVSGTGSIDIPIEEIVPVLLEPAEYDSAPAWSPSVGHNSSDTHLNYVGSFPVTSMKYGLQNLADQLLGGPPDFVLSGPNVGANTGITDEFSGTDGVAAAAAVEDNIPAIAFSGANSAHRSWTALQPGDISYLYSALSLKIFSQVLASGTPYLPAQTYLNVNFPEPSSACSTAATGFKFVLTTAFSTSERIDCGNTPISTEDTALAAGCTVTISAMTSTSGLPIKEDASQAVQSQVQAKLAPLLTCFGAE